ncbi:MAG: glycosyltransferase [bacterium]
MNQFISIIIPVKNGEKTIKKCLDSLKNLNYTNYEIIVIDDNSSDKTQEILSSYEGIQTMKTSGVGPASSRNLGIKQAKGDYLAFTDADCIVHPEWLKELLKGFDEDSVVGVGGDQQSPDDESEFGKIVQGFLKTVGFVTDYIKAQKTMIETKHNPSCNVMYKKEIFDKLGGFLEGLWPGEDVEFDYRIKKLKKYKLKYNPQAIVYHYRPDNLREFCQMMKNYGWAQGFLVKKYGVFRLIHYEPLFLLILALSSLWSLVIGHWPLVFGLLCFVAFSLWFLLKTKSMKKTLQFTRLLVMTIIYWNLGFVSGLISASRSGGL